ncbi:MAG: tetratricopeptide repeat protein [Myxococcaceae bacterium]|nr:tetratricopeptide repeat protein [Myxococcaceae bacterium]
MNSNDLLKTGASKLDQHPGEAEAAFAAAARENPKDLQALLSLGAAQLKQQKLTEAAQSFERAVKVDATSVVAGVLHALALENDRQYAQAIEAWKRVATLDPTSMDAQEHLAALGDLTRSTQVSLSARQALAALRPGNPAVLSDLGVYLSRAGKHADAVRAFERAQLLEPGFVERHAAELAAYTASREATRKR